MKRLVIYVLLSVFFVSSTVILFPQNTLALSGSQFKPGRIIDDSIFFNGNAMTATQIQNFLNAKVPVCDTNGTKPYGGTTRRAYATSRGVSTPFICLKDYRMNTPSKAGESGLCSAIPARSNRTAAQIIDDVSRACNVSQKSLIVLLEKEQSLITDDWPWSIQYRSATGYGCPDTAPCDSEYYGFFNQVYSAARQFKRYAANPTFFNHRPSRTSFVQFNPSVACGGTNVFIENQATAGLYNYTPYQPNSAALNNLYGSGNNCSAYGNRNFWRLHNDWFGSPISTACARGSNLSGVRPGRLFLSSDLSGRGSSNIVFALQNGTGSTCVEAHTWNNGFKTWQSNRASNLPSMDPSLNSIISGNIHGDSRDELVNVRYSTASGKVELHVWSQDLRKWVVQTTTPLPNISQTQGEIIAGDLNGDGRDEIIFVKYSGSGNRTEIHVMSPDFKRWTTQRLTVLSAFNPSTGRIIAGDLNGDGRDELSFIKYSGSSGRVEIHTFRDDLRSFTFQKATFLGTINSTSGTIISGNVNSDRRDELLFVKYNGSSGRVEIHTFSSRYDGWQQNIATNLAGFSQPL